MSCHAGPDIVKNGLVFCYDMNNTQKSWKGAPTTNLISNPTKEVIATVNEFAIFEDISPIFDANGPGYYSISADIKSAIPGDITVYTASGAVEYNIGFYTAACETYYKRFYFNNINVTQTDPNTTYSNLSFYGGYGSGRKPSITNVQIEKNSFCTPFVAGTRSNTQAILDLTNKSIITTNNLTYDSNGIFSFNGSTSYISIANPITSNLPYSITQWIKPDNALTDTTETTGAGRKTPLVGPGPQWSPGYWLTARTFRVHSFTEYRDHSINLVGDLNWHFIGQIFDGINCYGILDGVILSGGIRTAYSPGLQSSILIGAENTTGNSYNWNGKLGKLQIYNRVLSAAEVSQNFNATRKRYGI